MKQDVRTSAPPRTVRRPLRARRRTLSAFFLVLALTLVLGVSASALTLFLVFRHFSRDLPSIDSLRRYEPKTVTYFYADDGRVIGEFSQEYRIVVPLGRIPPQVVKAFLAAEDHHFFTHQGIDLEGVVRALWKNLWAGRIVQGGSTITQQVTRTFLLSPEKSFARKIREAILAYRLDSHLTKEQILFLYLNQIYLGHGAYGVEAAAQVYFGAHAEQLTLAQAALIAGLTQAPSRYSPYAHPEQARQRQEYTLRQMVEAGFITEEEAARALAEKIVLKDRADLNQTLAPYFTEHVRRMLEQRYGAQRLYNDGLRVYTTVDIEAQQAAQEAVARGLRDLSRRHGYRGPLDLLARAEMPDFLAKQTAALARHPLENGLTTQAVVTGYGPNGRGLLLRVGSAEGFISPADLAWALPQGKPVDQVFPQGAVVSVRAAKQNPPSGQWDFTLEQETATQAALLCVDLERGEVKAMVGGRDFRQSQFNRAVQARRQPGSAFKPIIYTAAMDHGFTPSSIIIDSPLTFYDSVHMRRWSPQNYDDAFLGPTMLHMALAKSRNVVTVKLLQRIGLRPVLEYARRMGITSPLSPNLSLALGTSAVTLEELVTAYTPLARLGEKIEPIFVTRVEDRYGRVLERMTPQREQVISPETAYVMLSMMRGVVQYGTATQLQALGRPLAGKTGTTDDLADAWFVGFTPEILTGVWVGNDDMKRLGDRETGSRAAVPIFQDFMSAMLKNQPVREFRIPAGVTFAFVNEHTGAVVGENAPGAIRLCFKEGGVRPGAIEREAGPEPAQGRAPSARSEKEL
jgi:penicillin-binding protein 1A